MAYGFLDRLLRDADHLKPSKVVFTWDGKNNVRKEYYPEYKAPRRKRFQKGYEKELNEAAFPKFFEIRDEVLPLLGFKNIICEEGFEADDIMGDICIRFRNSWKIFLVAEDNDLYQLLHSNVSMYSTKTSKLFRERDFREKYGLSPKEWAVVKSIAGCSGDNVKGVNGVGVGRAKSYIEGTLKRDSRYYKAIEDCKKTILRNVDLVSLPHKGTPFSEIVDDDISFDTFQNYCIENKFWGLMKKEKQNIWKEVICGQNKN